MTSNLTRCLVLLQKPVIINVPRSAFPKLALVTVSRYVLRCKLVKHQCLFQVSLGLKEVQIEAHDFKLDIVPLFRSQTCEYQCFEACCPRTSACASKPLLLRCKLAILQCLCQVSLGLKEVQMGALDFKLKKVHPFAKRPVNIKVLCPETSSCASKPLWLPYIVFIC